MPSQKPITDFKRGRPNGVSAASSGYVIQSMDIHEVKPHARMALRDGEVHLFSICLGDPTWDIDALACSLAHDEKRRAARFVNPTHAHHFIIGRGVLRRLLARYVGCSPAELRLAASPHGKPFMAMNADADRIAFNLSHSGDYCVLAITRDRQIGVDLERIEARIEDMVSNPQIFTDKESEQLIALPQPQQVEAFFRLWTCKEALLKARGAGLMSSPGSIDVSRTLRQGAARIDMENQTWNVSVLAFKPGFACALAINDGDLLESCHPEKPTR